MCPSRGSPMIRGGGAHARRGSAPPPTDGQGGMGRHGSITAVRRLACAAIAVMALAVAAAPARADFDALHPQACQDLPGTCLLTPFFPEENPLTAAKLGTPGSPEDDLAAALDDLSTADTATQAQDDIDRALAILQGDPVDRAPYSGIPLLNWNLPAKVKTVPAGGTVDVREVRFGDHALLDTWMLDFEDTARPYTIHWHIAELGTSFGGKLTPAVVRDGAGEQVAQRPLALPNLDTGTMSHGRFHPDGAEEQTRLATQGVSG